MKQSNPIRAGSGAGLGCFAAFFWLAMHGGYGGALFFFAGCIAAPIVGILVSHCTRDQPPGSNASAATPAIVSFYAPISLFLFLFSVISANWAGLALALLMAFGAVALLRRVQLAPAVFGLTLIIVVAIALVDQSAGRGTDLITVAIVGFTCVYAWRVAGA